jgi:hypothetical protein
MATRIRFGFTDDDIWVAGSTRNLIIPVTDAAGAAVDLTGACCNSNARVSASARPSAGERVRP